MCLQTLLDLHRQNLQSHGVVAEGSDCPGEGASPAAMVDGKATPVAGNAHSEKALDGSKPSPASPPGRLNAKLHIIDKDFPRLNGDVRSSESPPGDNRQTSPEAKSPVNVVSPTKRSPVKASDKPMTNGHKEGPVPGGQGHTNGVANANGPPPVEGKVGMNGHASVNGFALMNGDDHHFATARERLGPGGSSGAGSGGGDAPAPDDTDDARGAGFDPEAEASWDRAVAGVKEQAFARLQEELRRAHRELKLRDEEVTRLSRIREEVEAELEELTASLFQEAHNMVREANMRQAAAERSYKESQMQVEVLTAEVAALKTLVLTSTPSRPNPHLHPQIDPRNGTSVGHTRDDTTISGVSLFNRKHRRSPSHFNLKYGRENSPPESPVKEQRPTVPSSESLDSKDGWEVDPNIHKEFVAWKQNAKLDKSDPFIARIYKEDINLCLDFTNSELGALVLKAIEEGNIFIEAVSDKSKTVFPKKCALLEAPRQCYYRMKLGDQEQWYYISQICRNRIIAVCDFLNYLRYIERGLVKSSVHDVYWEITRLRKEMVLARLGLALSTQ